MQAGHRGERTMSEKVDYVDWDTIVQKAEANLEIIKGNKKRSEVGELCEKLVLEYALKERGKYPEPKKEEPSNKEKPSDNSREKPSDEELSQAKK